jgi:hypothetical protein
MSTLWRKCTILCLVKVEAGEVFGVLFMLCYIVCIYFLFYYYY